MYALADGRTSLATISARLVAEHPELFTSPDEALEFARDALALGEATPGTSGR